MSAVKVSNGFYVCDSNSDRDVSWADGTVCAVRDATHIAVFYKLVSGSFVFQYNQSDAPSPSSLYTLIANLIPDPTTNEGKVLKVVSGVLAWATESGGGYSGDPTVITQDATHRFATDAEKSTWNGKENAGTAASAIVALTQDSIPDGTTAKQYSSTEKTKLAGIASGATANSSDATLLNCDNHTDGTTNKAFLATERTKLSGIATAATANDTDANLKARANHTGTQTASTVSDFAAAALLAAPAETLTTTGALIASATAKTTLVDADYVGAMDSAASNVLKKWSFANIKANLKSYFDTLYLNQSTSGTAANLSGTPALPNGTTATTQSAADNSTKLATTAYVDTGLGTKAPTASPTFTGVVTMPTGSTSAAAYNIPAQTLKTTPAAGDNEFDGVNYYATIDTTSGRGAYAAEQYFHLTAAGSTISTIANFFGSTSNISLVASAYYLIEIELWYLKTTSGTVTWTLTNSATPTSQNIYYEMSPVTGIVAPPGTGGTMLVGQVYGDATAAKTTVTAALTTAVNHYAKIKIWLKNGTGTSLKIQATCSAGTITPGINSYWRCRRISPNNIGTFAT